MRRICFRYSIIKIGPPATCNCRSGEMRSPKTNKTNLLEAHFSGNIKDHNPGLAFNHNLLAFGMRSCVSRVS